jgi:hypothetical protein
MARIQGQPTAHQPGPHVQAARRFSIPIDIGFKGQNDRLTK